MKREPLYSSLSEKPSLISRQCHHPDCSEEGDYRAPKNRDTLTEYYWFCLPHVQAYNKQWDYYKGMSSEEITASRIDDITWNRPSWPLGKRFTQTSHIPSEVENLFKSSRNPSFHGLPEPYKKALIELELNLPLTIQDLKNQYKKLVKQYHPDKNKGDKDAEEKFKKITNAYNTLKPFLKL